MTLILTRGEIVTCKVLGLGSDGEGIADHLGMKIFVEGAIPGEVIKLRITQVKKNYAHGVLITVVTPSEHRTRAPCPYFDRCGGCQIQHLTHSFQLEMKRNRVVEALRRIGKIENVEVLPCVPSEKNFGYRNKIQFPVSKEKKLGLYQKGSHEIVPVDACLLHLPLGEQLFVWMRDKLFASGIEPYNEITKRGELRHVLIRSTLHTHEALVGLVTVKKPSAVIKKICNEMMEQFPFLKGVVHIQNKEETNRILSPHSTILAGKNEICENLGPFTFLFSLESFFQVNPYQAANLYQAALDHSGVSSNDVVLDAFCGVGTLSAFFAKKAKQVYGVECVPKAIENAKKNGQINQLENVEFTCGDIDHLIGSFSDVDYIILNPPRKGCSEKTLHRVAEFNPRGIVYVSCDPATLSRDLAILQIKGYKITHVQPFDMFPQTMHVETLAILKKC